MSIPRQRLYGLEPLHWFLRRRSLAQAGLKLAVLLQPQLPTAWMTRRRTRCTPSSVAGDAGPPDAPNWQVRLSQLPSCQASPGLRATHAPISSPGKQAPGRRRNVRDGQGAGPEEEGRTPPEPLNQGRRAQPSLRPLLERCAPGIGRPTSTWSPAGRAPPGPSDPRHCFVQAASRNVRTPRATGTAPRNVASGDPAPHPDPGPPCAGTPSSGRPAPPPLPLGSRRPTSF